MSLFLSPQVLKDSVKRLSTAAIVTSFSDYLIFKRALINTKRADAKKKTSNKDFIVTGTQSEPFVQAVEEFTLRIPIEKFRTDLKIENPYYMPFGSERDKTLGYRTRKFPSNGSSDTVSRWQSRSSRPIELVPNTSPKAYSIVSLTATELGEFFLLKNINGNKPSVIDAAVWWYRFTDLEEVFKGEPTSAELSNLFILDVGINDVELSALFLANLTE